MSCWKSIPDVVHFSGHASDGLYLVGSDGLPQVMTGGLLPGMINAAATRLRLVVLNACYSEAQAAALSNVVDCVVGVAALISDHAAVAFSVAFYEALASGLSAADAAAVAGRGSGGSGSGQRVRTSR